MQEVRVASEAVTILVNLLLHLLVLDEVGFPLLPVVVALRALQAAQHRAVVIHDAGQVLDANFAVQRVVLVPSFRVALGLHRRLRWVLSLQVDLQHLPQQHTVFILNLSHALYSFVRQKRSYRGCSVLSSGCAACAAASSEESRL